ncbi:MAG: 50S ribosomal protein L4 [Firmicutes bacterium ADurb.Bin300]|jgi:large subunit ribosomal protein L4|nr:MAG: 50S ribosomal protein L4 [Firmicutes bacterium ADurb.Bin300]
MKVSVLDMTGNKVSDMELSEAVFGIQPNTSAMHLAVVSYLANQRQGTHSTLTRGQVRGGGRKPWRQKGTGRARQGSIRSPQWYHGGIAFGPKPRSYGISLNKKVKKLAMKSALSSKITDNDLIVVDKVSLDSIKTKEMVKVFNALKTKKKVLLVLSDKDESVYKSVRNIEGAATALVGSLSVYDILNCDTLILVKDAVSKLEEVYAQ